jgi:hypothetical protein
MAQHDYVIANGTGAAVRSDLNNGLAAIVSNNSGATEPGTMYAYQWWADTTTGLLKQRNAANNAWITIGTLASANLGLLSLAGGTMTGALAVTAGTAALPGIAVSGDLNTGITSPGADQLAISTGGTSRLAVSTTAVSSTLAVDVPLGAAATPSITFTGDLNTGIYSPGADQLAVATNGVQRINIEADGDINIDGGGMFYDATNNRLAIGTTSPASVLNIVGTTTFNNTEVSGGYNTLQIIPATTIGSSVNRIATINTTGLSFETGGSESAAIDTSGRLLVGTATDLTGALLQVNGAMNSNKYQQNVTAGSTDTIFTMAASQCYHIYCTEGTNQTHSVAIASCAEGSSTAVLTSLYQSSDTTAVVLSASGLNIQVYNGAGSTRTIKTTILRMA